MFEVIDVWKLKEMTNAVKKKKSQSMSGDFVFWKVILNIADLIDVVYVLSLIHWFVKNQKGFSYMSTETDDERFTCTIHWISWVCVEKFVSFKNKCFYFKHCFVYGYFPVQDSHYTYKKVH